MSPIKRRFKKAFETPRQIALLLRNKHPVVCALGKALHAYQSGELTIDERMWIDAIEGVRAELYESTDEVHVPDYGAGSPDARHSSEVQRAGRMVTEVLGDACRNYSKSASWSRLLFHVARKVRPTRCVELGTCLGISAAYQAAALELNGCGELVTLEGAPAFAAIASRNLEALGLSHRISVVTGRFEDSLPNILNRTPVDYAFIDGHHDESATLNYYRAFLPSLAACAVMVFDDVAWSEGMRAAWRRIRFDSRIDVSLDLGAIGICVVGVGDKLELDIVL